MLTSAPPATGTVVGGDFRIVRQLGAGGMGAVYVAEQASTGKLRALKLMHPALVADARQRERFAQEARVSALIPSEHVVQVIGAGVDPATGAPWIAMELLEGEDLAITLRRRGALPPAEVHELFRQICHALGAAHRAGIVHRDIKPENVFLARARLATEAVTARVLDFGIAKVVAEAGATGTAAMGTPLWMAPEQTDAHARLTPAADVWPLGLMAFSALTGRMYWRAGNKAPIRVPPLLREVLFEPLAPASERAAELGSGALIPPGFDAWFARCLERDPDARFPTAAEALDALGPALFGDATATPAAALTPPAFEDPAPPAPALAAPPAPALAASPAAPTDVTPGAGPSWMFAPTDVATPPLTPPVPPPPVAAALPPPPVAAAPPHPPQPPVGALRRGGRGALLLLAGVGGGVVISLVVAMALFAPGRGFRPQRRPGLSREPAAPAVVVGPSAVEPGRAETSSRPAPPPPTPPPPPLLPAPLPAPTAASSAPAPRPFDVEAAQRSVQQAATFARSTCAQKSGPPRVEATVVFEAGGQVDDVKMKPADHATPFGECVNGKLRTASNVPPFDGPPQPVGTTVARP